nr:MAG TPA: hypothetical protein [Caudoviricetes sp.]
MVVNPSAHYASLHNCGIYRLSELPAVTGIFVIADSDGGLDELNKVCI